ncbi:hypothetical protein V8C42DRAFT_325669 [Trichoderma barbatum]
MATNHQFCLRCKGIIRLSDSDNSHQTPYCICVCSILLYLCRHPSMRNADLNSVSLRSIIRHYPYEKRRSIPSP